MDQLDRAETRRSLRFFKSKRLASAAAIASRIGIRAQTQSPKPNQACFTFSGLPIFNFLRNVIMGHQLLNPD